MSGLTGLRRITPGSPASILLLGAVMAASYARPSKAETTRKTVTDVDEALARYVIRCPDQFGDGVRGPIVLLPDKYDWNQYKDTFVNDVTRAWNDVLRAAPIKKVFKSDDGSKIETGFESCTVVRFSISKTGDVGDVIVQDARGPSSVKELALAAVKKMKISGLPKDFPEDHAEANVQFLVKAESPSDFRTKLWDGAYTFIYSTKNPAPLRLKSPPRR